MQFVSEPDGIQVASGRDKRWNLMQYRFYHYCPKFINDFFSFFLLISWNKCWDWVKVEK